MKSINLLGLWFYGYLYVLQSASFFHGLQVGCLQSASFFLVSKQVTCRVQSASFFSGIQVGYLQRASFFLVSRQVWSGNLYSAGWGKAQLSTLKLKRHCHEIFIFSAREEKYLEKVPCLKCMPCSDPSYFYLIFI